MNYKISNVNYYINHLKSAGRSESTIKSAQRILSSLFKYFESNGINEVMQIRKNGIEGYLEHVYANFNYSASSKKLIIYFIKDYFKTALDKGLIAVDPAKKLKGPRLEKLLPKDIPNDKEVKRIITGIPKDKVRDRAIIEILYGSGLRTNEVTALKLVDIDYERQYLKVKDKKNKTERLVPFNDITGYVIKEYVEKARENHIKCIVGRSPHYDEVRAKNDSNVYLFLSNGGLSMHCNTVRRIVKKHVCNSGIKKKITPHCLRHACACEMLKNGAGIRWIQKMLGHEDINTTMIYTKIGIEDLKKIVDRMHPHGTSTGSVSHWTGDTVSLPNSSPQAE
jgi:integrase/recombinase XerC